MPPLDGARLKIVRAQEHLKSFNEIARRYIDTQPYAVVSKIEGDCISIEGVITAEPPPSLACIVGDFVTNLRASLDYIAWELVQFAGNTLTESEQKRVTFPIILTQARFTDPKSAAMYLGGNTCGIPASTLSIIESVQPYQTGYEVMGVLDLLVRIDKHRTLLLCALLMHHTGGYSVYRGNELMWTVRGRGLRSGEYNLRAMGPSFLPATNYRMEMDEQPTVLITFKDFPVPETRVGVLDEILNCVERIIPQFDHIFI
jgi:hypothetical protein